MKVVKMVILLFAILYSGINFADQQSLILESIQKKSAQFIERGEINASIKYLMTQFYRRDLRIDTRFIIFARIKNIKQAHKVNFNLVALIKPLYDEIIKKLGPGHYISLFAAQLLIATYSDEGDNDNALKYALIHVNLYNKKEECADMNRFIGRIYFEKQQYEESLQYNNNALKIYTEKNESKKYNKNIAIALQNISILYKNLGKYPEAIEALKKSLTFVDEKNNDYYKNYVRMGSLYLRNNKYKYARKYFNEAMDYYKNTDKNILDAINAIVDIANIEEDYEYNREAVEHYQIALEKSQKIQNEKLNAEILNRMGFVYRQMEQFAKAGESHRQSLEIYKKLSLKNEVAFTYGYLAMVSRDNKNFTEADDYYQQAIKIREELHQENMPVYAYLLTTYAYFKQNMLRHTVAFSLYEKSLDIMRNCKNNGGQGYVMHYMAKLYRTKKEYKKAVITLLDAVDIIQKNSGPNDPALAELYNDLASIYEQVGAREEAKDYSYKAIDVATAAYGENHPKTRTYVWNFRGRMLSRSIDSAVRLRATFR